jgi:hypothetical protein
MEWIGAAGLAFAFVLIAFSRWRRRDRNPEAMVRFDMLLPSQWAAELCQRVLEGEGINSELRRQAARWVCRVSQELRLDSDRCESLRAHFDQIARARGGECPEFSVDRKT